MIVGRSFHAKTSTTYVYGQVWVPVRGASIVFKVQACGSASIALSQMYRVVTDGAYEVVIGAENNRRTYIRQKLGKVTIKTLIYCSK